MTESEIEAAWQMGKHAADYEEQHGVLPYPKPNSDSNFSKWWRRGYTYQWRNFHRIKAQLELNNAQRVDK
jgi:hypothetical protein